MKTQTLATSASSKRLRELSNACLNLIEDMRSTIKQLDKLDTELSNSNLMPELPQDLTADERLVRISQHLVNLEAVAKSAELVAAHQSQLRELSNDKSEHVLPTNRQTSRIGRAIQKLANAIG